MLRKIFLSIANTDVKSKLLVFRLQGASEKNDLIILQLYNIFCIWI